MKKKITILPKGPYRVTGDVPLKQAIIETDRRGISMRWKEGKTYQNTQDSYLLCRCGHSKKKPYCDGTHSKVGFEGEETASKAPYLSECIEYKGEELTLYDNVRLCSSMRFCDRGKGVWKATIDSSDPESKRMAVEEACDCASGRLTAANKDGTMIEPKLPEEIALVEDTAAGRKGPLWVKGGIELEGADGEVYGKRNRMTLCRCGQSRNMPFCDISHMRAPWMKGFDE